MAGVGVVLCSAGSGKRLQSAAVSPVLFRKSQTNDVIQNIFIEH